MKKVSTSNISVPQQKLYEQAAWENNKLIIGIDEVGRGALAGPLVVSAALLPPHTDVTFLKDSKILTDNQKLHAFTWLRENAWYHSAILSAAFVDTHGIYQATLIGMKRAYYGLISILHHPLVTYESILVDAMPLRLDIHHPPVISLIKGESKSISIAAASIVAKVTRDAIMDRMAVYIPHYDFQKNKAYGTAFHCAELIKRGPSIVHRTTFIGNYVSSSKETDEPHHQQTSLLC